LIQFGSKMKLFASILGLSLSITTVASQATLVATFIGTLQSSEPDILEQNVFSDSDSYQSLALIHAVENLPNEARELEIRNYYALMCIYFATNGVGNPKTDEAGFSGAVEDWFVDDWTDTNDYCDWYGIECDQERHVTKIELYNNNLNGQFPNEVVLLNDYLNYIDLFDNYYLWSNEPKWMQKMTQLEYLYFGTTSFEAIGVSRYLAGCVNLLELDMSFTYWSFGAIDGEIFEPLTKLYYLDIGNQKLEVGSDGEPIPAAVRALPLLHFYMDSCEFNASITMEFVSSLTDLIELRLDYTQFTGGIPTTLGLLTNLDFFSATYSGLSGRLPTELSDTSLTEVFLYGNNLSGEIPSEWGEKLKFKYLFLEQNQLSGVIPSSICNVPSTAFGADCDLCDGTSCCYCCGDQCGNIDPPTPEPTLAPTSEPTPTSLPTPEPTPTIEETWLEYGLFCFSGSSLVEVEHRGSVRMEDLAIGDTVRVNNNTFEPIYSFGHKDKTASAEFLRIKTKGSSTAIEISPDHMVAIENGRYVPASLVKKGDKLLIVSNELAAVTSIKTVVRKGIFAPFTASGNIVVNGVVASNYVAYQGSEYVKIGEMETPFSYQFMGHTFNSVHRLAVMVGITGETYTSEGISNWVATAHEMTSWVADQNTFISSLSVILGLVFLLPLLMLARLVEMLVCSPVAIACAVGGITFMMQKKSVNTKIIP